MSMFGKSKLNITPLPPEDEQAAAAFEPPVAAYAPVSLESTDPNRTTMIEAARAYDETQRRIADLEAGLRNANAELGSKNRMIDELCSLLEHERENQRIAAAARDQAYNERSEALAILANVRSVVDHPDIPLAARGGRKRKPMVETATPEYSPPSPDESDTSNRQVTAE